MTSVYVLMAVLVVIVAALCALKWRRKSAGAAQRNESLAQLDDVLRTAQMTNATFFQSLELVQKNLESLLARAESAEQRLRTLMLQPGAEKKEQYTAAALLLGEGQEPQRVASMLNLPLPQVQIVRELQKMTGKEKKPASRRLVEEPSQEREHDSQSKIAAPREKTAAQPMRLVDVIRKAASEAAKQEGQFNRFNGVSA
jgi:hypothetical protein